MARTAYNPGTPQPARQTGPATWAVDSFRGETVSYSVNLANATCSCPHFCGRLAGTGEECKHLQSVRRQSQWLAYVDRARTLSDENLGRLLVKYTEQGRAEIAGALRFVRDERRRQSDRNANLREMFA